MPLRIGLLLPRSIDYPSISFDLLDGLRLQLSESGHSDVQVFTDNIGLGDKEKDIYAGAEKMILSNDVQAVIAFANMLNAEGLFALAESTGKPFIFLDAGMQFASNKPNLNCSHISLQGLSGCHQLGRLAGEGGRKVLMATGFFDAGFRCSMASLKGLQEKEGTVAGNFASKYKISEFTIDSYLQALHDNAPEAVIANFSIYLAELFFAELRKTGSEATPLPFYASPFMAEELLLAKNDFPGGTWNTVVPWALSLDNPQQQQFKNILQKEKNKTATIFHLLGWEAGIVAQHAIANGPASLTGWSYESPRGKITFHPDTRMTYGPLYRGGIEAAENGRCHLRIDTAIELSAEDHAGVFVHEKEEEYPSGWKNNYFCA